MFRFHRLQKAGIDEEEIKKMMKAGFTTVESVAFAPENKLIAVKGLSTSKVDRILAKGDIFW
jgi:DNA repair protein RAD51